MSDTQHELDTDLRMHCLELAADKMPSFGSHQAVVQAAEAYYAFVTGEGTGLKLSGLPPDQKVSV